MKKRKALLVSGGGSWGAFGGGTLQRLNKDYNTIIGVSTGSLLAALGALKEWEQLKTSYTTANETDVFDRCWYKGRPLNKKNEVRKFPIIMTLLLGQKSVFTTKSLRKRIDKYYLKEHHDRLQEKNIDVRVGTLNFAQHPPKMHYFSSMFESYEDFKDWCWSSASFPIYGSLIKKSWEDTEGNFHVGQWSDGGLSDLVGIDELKDGNYGEVDIILHRTKIKDRFEGKSVHNLIENIDRSVRAMRYDIEFDYFYERIKRLNEQGTKVTVYWLPRKLHANPIHIDREQMLKWWDEGYETALDLSRIEVFEPIKRKF